jgi:hypothetical protein
MQQNTVDGVNLWLIYLILVLDCQIGEFLLSIASVFKIGNIETKKSLALIKLVGYFYHLKTGPDSFKRRNPTIFNNFINYLF